MYIEYRTKKTYTLLDNDLYLVDFLVISLLYGSLNKDCKLTLWIVLLAADWPSISPWLSRQLLITNYQNKQSFSLHNIAEDRRMDGQLQGLFSANHHMIPYDAAIIGVWCICYNFYNFIYNHVLSNSMNSLNSIHS